MVLIKSNDASVTYAKPTTAAALVWRNFSFIYVDNQQQNFVSCDACKSKYRQNFSPYSKFIVHRFVKYLLSMKLTAAQKQKRNRENLKRKGRHNTVKAKNRERTQNLRSKLSDFQREQYRNHDAAARKRTRAANKHQSNASFGSKQSLALDLSKTSFAELRPQYVMTKALMSHRV
ncbi:unnamed protein product [Rotaria socialis]|uniref:Uncharacterized protein n=1 Tax=Rotaria socialis TaxID=392032 RepID=A0A820YKS7_9BILA|nr:unnamed protein product [Rotaria socialis]